MRLEDLIGRRLGRYEIREVLGRGGMAAVYRARDHVLRRDVALKILYPQYTGDTALVERFQREAVLAAGLDHPNILPIYDVGEADGLVYIAMRLLSGQSLADVLRLRGAIPADELLPITDQIAAALDYAHARQVVHRDIKPANILIEGTDPATMPGSLAHARAILTDFGIAKSLDPATSGLTVTGVLIGTPEYMAPEQIRGGHTVDGRADIYALGVLVYRAITGQRPFEGSTQEVLFGHLQGTVAAPASIDPAIPPALSAAILKALARDPNRRYASAGEFARALRSAAGLEPPTPPPALRRSADGRVVVPSIAIGELARDNAAIGAQATRQGDAAPPYAGRNSSPTSAQVTQPGPAARRTPRATATAAQPGSNLAWALLGVMLALLIGGGAIYGARMLTGNPDSGALVAASTATPTPPLATAPPIATAPQTAPAAATAELATQAAQVPAASPAPTAAPTARPPAPTARPQPTAVRPQPTAQPTLRPIETPAPTSAPPSATPSTTPSATPAVETPAPTACPAAPAPDFATFLQSQAQIKASLGCATQDAQNRPIAEQNFERGAMIWVAGASGRNGTIYVIFDDETRAKTTWQAFEDLWQEGDPDDSGDETAPSGRYEPQRGFGKLWYANKDIHNTLGWAKEERERGSAGVIQRFANGRLLYNPHGFGAGASIYALNQDGGFAQYSAP